MSHVYLLKASGQRRPTVWIGPLEPGFFRDRFNGKPLSRDWQPPIREVRGLSYSLPDAMLWTGPGPLLSQKAVRAFETAAPGCAEYPHFTDIKGKPYYAIYVRNETDALDEERSEINISTAGTPLSIRRHAFKPGMELPPLFKLPSRLAESVYCTDVIASTVLDNRLKGFSFWDPTVPHLKDLFLGKTPTVCRELAPNNSSKPTTLRGAA
jgi:hypothetical protein